MNCEKALPPKPIKPERKVANRGKWVFVEPATASQKQDNRKEKS